MALLWYDTELNPPRFSLPDNQELRLLLGAKTLVNLTTDRSLTFVGLAAIGGNVNGAVVTFSVLNASFNLSWAHLSPLASSPNNRFWCAGAVTAVGATGVSAITFRYHSTLGLWVQIARA